MRATFYIILKVLENSIYIPFNSMYVLNSKITLNITAAIIAMITN